MRAAAVWLICSVGLAAQQPRDLARTVTAGTAEISGTVVADDASAAPVRRATIMLTADSAAIRLNASTDDSGKFSFVGLPAGRYSLSASKGAYLASAYGSKRPGGPGIPIAVSDGQRVSGITLKILKGSVLAGTIVDERGQPVAGAAVSVSKLGWSEWSVLNGERIPQVVSLQFTDPRGMYRIYGLMPGEYVVSATLALRPSDATVIGNSIFTSPRATIDVRQITDEDVQRAQQILRGSVGASTIQSMPASGTRQTPPAMVSYAPVYYPSITSITEAARITLGRQEERTGIDVQLRLVPTARVEGVVSGPDGRPMPNIQVLTMDSGPKTSETLTRVHRSAQSDQNGRFVLTGLGPGQYAISAAARPSLWGTSDVAVDGRDVSASITLAPGVTMSGRLIFEGASPRPADLDTFVPLVQAMRGVSPGGLFGLGRQVNDDGTFTFMFAPGTYRVQGLGNRAWRGLGGFVWQLKSVIVNGADISDVAFDIRAGENVDSVVVTLTDQRTELSGTMQDAAGKPALDYVLIVFPAEPRLQVPLTRRTQQVRPDANGRFIVSGLPPGDYLISALTDVEDGQWNDAAFLAQLAAQAPIKISLSEGEKKVQDIRVVR